MKPHVKEAPQPVAAPSANDKAIRALYLKGVVPGKSCTIELTQPISGRNADHEHVHLAESGAHLQALMTKAGWQVSINGQDVLVPLVNGKLR